MSPPLPGSSGKSASKITSAGDYLATSYASLSPVFMAILNYSAAAFEIPATSVYNVNILPNIPRSTPECDGFDRNGLFIMSLAGSEGTIATFTTTTVEWLVPAWLS